VLVASYVQQESGPLMLLIRTAFVIWVFRRNIQIICAGTSATARS
jgi:hypothetical protein